MNSYNAGQSDCKQYKQNTYEFIAASKDHISLSDVRICEHYKTLYEGEKRVP